MKILFPIGGGEISKKETIILDRFLLKLSNKENPKVLFIPTASNDYKGYIDRFKCYFEELGAIVDVLALSYMTNDNLIRSKVFSADIIYIGGGNTAKMMRVFKRTNMIAYLKEAYESGIIMSGLSAGSIVYFTSGYSDSNRSTDPNASLCLVKGLDLIPYCNCPHYNNEERKSFDSFVIEKGLNGLALDENAALLVIDNEIKGVVKGNNNANGYYLINGKKEVIKEYK